MINNNVKKLIITTLLLAVALCSCSGGNAGKTDTDPDSVYPSGTQDATDEENTYEDYDSVFSEPKNQLFTDREKSRIETDVLESVKSVWRDYDSIELGGDTDFGSGITNFSDEQRKNVVMDLGKMGLVVRSDNINTENPGKVKLFYEDYQNGKPAEITVYDIYRDGLVSTLTFLYRDDEIQTYYVGVGPDENMNPVISGRLVQEIDYINLTEKGYFIYAYRYIMDHQSLCQYFRVSPLSEECRMLTEKYVKDLNFQKYNLMVTDWDSGSVSKVLMPGLFEDFYYIKYGRCYETACDIVPGDVFEDILTTYLPVSIDQLRNAYYYDDARKEYHQDLAYNRPYPPFGEVVDYRYNGDGTITLFVDGVWPDYKSDYAFTSEILIRPFSGTSFRILSNKVEEKELKLPAVAYKSDE